MRLILIAALTLLAASPAWCNVKRVSANEVHESANNNMVKGFVEDVISLLPQEFRNRLDANVILSSVKFTGNRNKWLNYATMSEKDLSNIYAQLANRYARNKIGDIALSDELGNTVSTIIETAMTHGGNDPLGDKSKANLDSFFRDEYKMTHVIRYEGYNACKIQDCIARIYDLAKLNKSTIYPLLVSRTADLWTAVYSASNGQLVSDAKTIVRRPMNIAFGGRPAEKSSGTQSTNGSLAASTPGNSTSGNSNAPGESLDPDTAIIILVPVSR